MKKKDGKGAQVKNSADDDERLSLKLFMENMEKNMEKMRIEFFTRTSVFFKVHNCFTIFFREFFFGTVEN